MRKTGNYWLAVLCLWGFNATLIASLNNGWINIVEKGADNTGQVLCGEVIKASIEEAHQRGGGTVFIPAGVYLTGPIHLKSNVTLHLDAGALVRFSTDFDLYLPFVQQRWEGTVMMNFSPLIYAHGQENIAITGRGKLDGQGREWWRWHYNNKQDPEVIPRHKYFDMWEAQNAEVITEDYYWNTMKWRFFRPPMVQFFDCSNVLVDGITLVNSPFWTLNPAFSDNITINDVTINNPPSPNTDGINPTSCRNVRISNCHISVGDDCITIKSGRDIDGRKWATPTENVTITNCTMLSGHGGIVIGSEVSGDIRKITISNCVFDGTRRGIRLKSARGRGGIVEDVRISNIVMRNIQEQALVFNLFYDPSAAPEPISERTPVFRNIHVSNLTAVNVKNACTFYGISEMPIQDLTFNNINIQAETGFVVNTGKNIELHNVEVSVTEGPSFIFENSSDLILSNVKSGSPVIGEPVVYFNQVKNAFLTNNFPLVWTDLFLEVHGDQSAEIFLQNNNFHNVKQSTQRSGEVKRKVVKALK
jgi:polygalacturonase